MSAEARTEPNEFPRGFLWGASTSSHQVEGDNDKNDWWRWEVAGKTADPSGKACDSYRRYREDFDLAKELGHNAHRYSIEWSRVEPREGQWNQEALDHYRDLTRALRERGIEPVVTLHHFTNPVWVTEKGGWEKGESVRYFTRYCRKVAEVLGEEVKFWITINEPTIFAYKGYIEKAWPPGKSSLFSLMKVLAHMAQAHCRVYDDIHALYRDREWGKPWVSLAHHVLIAQPCRPRSLKDRLAATSREILNNRLILKLVQHSFFYLPAYFFGTGGTKRTLDYVGLNYYLREVIASHGRGVSGLLGEVCREAHPHATLERNDMDWEIFPEGIHTVLMNLKKRWGLPILITENGIPTRDEAKRIRFIRDHLTQVLEAIHEGTEVIGYLHWSLLDNFEWSVGYSPRFGLIAVDPAGNRTVKSAAYDYAKICYSNRL